MPPANRTTGDARSLVGRALSTTAPTSGQVLTWNGTVWIATAAASDATTLQGRPVAATAPTASQVLAWDGAAWAPATPSGGAPLQTSGSGDFASGLSVAGSPGSSPTVLATWTLGTANGNQVVPFSVNLCVYASGLAGYGTGIVEVSVDGGSTWAIRCAIQFAAPTTNGAYTWSPSDLKSVANGDSVKYRVGLANNVSGSTFYVITAKDIDYATLSATDAKWAIKT